MENIVNKIIEINRVTESFESKLNNIHGEEFCNQISENLKIQTINYPPKTNKFSDLWLCFDFSKLSLFNVIFYNESHFENGGLIIGSISEDNIVLFEDQIIIESQRQNFNFLSFNKFIDFIGKLTYLSASNYSNEMTKEMFGNELLKFDNSKGYLDAIHYYFSGMLN